MVARARVRMAQRERTRELVRVVLHRADAARRALDVVRGRKLAEQSAAAGVAVPASKIERLDHCFVAPGDKLSHVGVELKPSNGPPLLLHYSYVLVRLPQIPKTDGAIV